MVSRQVRFNISWRHPGVLAPVLRCITVFAPLVLSSLLLWGALLTDDAMVHEPSDTNTLRFGAASRGILMGAAVAIRPLKNDVKYAATLGREFNTLVPEDAMKFGALQPSQAKFDFANADLIVDFAMRHAMQIRGHTLLWHARIPKWLLDGTFSSKEVFQILREHIQTVVGRYRGKIYAWDVVNEAVDDNTNLRQSFWLNTLGEDYISEAFVWAHEADPQAKLFYNDYGGEALGPKSDAIYNLLRDLKTRGIPVDGIGLQSHFSVEKPPNFEDVVANLKRLAALGLEIHVTELDVGVSPPLTPEKLERQADVYRQYLSACLSVANCKAFHDVGVRRQIFLDSQCKRITTRHRIPTKTRIQCAI